MYSLLISKESSLEDHLTMFKDIVTDFETLEVKYDQEDLVLILLCSLSPSYVTFRDTILYSQDILTVDEVYDVLLSKEKMRHLASGFGSQAEGFLARRKNQDRNLSRNIREWVLGLACTFHICPNKDWFTSAMIMKNNVPCKIIEVGRVRIKMFSDAIRTLIDVRHVLELQQILISLSILDTNE
ncbi:uncharacterized protein LOC111381915 [Olea europaea var. sylvestris]|uniref:uncharacterized protein LOC111381915 n=1 Tax=Olea europaea var. sylvestris TaxID=158386 RepID=UPI000C1D4CED|nr:uncharacterized protein LOC111381915 [Olea europaea var. sylvestris]